MEIFQDPSEISIDELFSDDPQRPAEGPAMCNGLVAGDEIYKVVRALISSQYIDHAVEASSGKFIDLPWLCTPHSHQMEVQNQADALEALEKPRLNDNAVKNLMQILSWDPDSCTHEIFCRKIKDFYLRPGKLSNEKAMGDLNYILRQQKAFKHCTLKHHCDEIEARIVSQLEATKLINPNIVILKTYLDTLKLLDKEIELSNKSFNLMSQLITKHASKLKEENSSVKRDLLLAALYLISIAKLKSGTDTTDLERTIVKFITQSFNSAEAEEDAGEVPNEDLETSLILCFSVLYKLPQLNPATKQELEKIEEQYDFKAGLKMRIASAIHNLLNRDDVSMIYNQSAEEKAFRSGDNQVKLASLRKVLLVYLKHEDKALYKRLAPDDCQNLSLMQLQDLSLLFTKLPELTAEAKANLEELLVQWLIKMHKEFSVIIPGTTVDDAVYDPNSVRFNKITNLLPKQLIDKALDYFFTEEYLASYQGDFREFSDSICNISRCELDSYLRGAEKLDQYLSKNLNNVSTRLDSKYPGWQNQSNEHINEVIRNLSQRHS